ncbi:hypothetical protein D3C81_1714480 [compost metagenome]
MDGHGRAVPGQVAQGLALGHPRLARVAGEDQRLRHLRQGQLAAQQRGAGSGGGYAGHHFIGDAQFAQVADLLANGAVERRVAGMHPRHVLPLGMGLGEQRDYFVEV